MAAAMPPYCLMVRANGRTMRVPEEWIARKRREGWSVLIRDSEMPYGGEMFSWRDLHSNPQRHRYRVDADFWREEGA